ncbi:hypothetical protein [Actinoplanes regularis]|uniref:Uncharacterized protein n=1 Tax=Actinoplanes regularis TaxID=52697 RepID=A0A239JZ90_9ACTN|nr:hypothetical protein [Actinoplanes regularis]GIE92370.1 hypothetical protein Are01nite_88500 [Actinoplanes regularis]SNT10939.1 hypothetical protein SAMN06264365_14014 [Actinoplanes regularis]
MSFAAALNAAALMDEVCFAAAAVQGVSRSDLLAMAERKREQRGGFDDRIVWLGNTTPGN